MKILITGGSGFIGSAVIRKAIQDGHSVVNVDALTYAACQENLTSVNHHERYAFEHVDIRNGYELENLFTMHKPDGVMHLAAESHVDRSIDGPSDFIETNITGTFNMLEAARNYWETHGRSDSFRFLHVSTDEVFGSLPDDPNEFFTEDTPYAPRSPYSASKASSDHFVRAYHHTYGLPIVISNCSNNYGPNHFPEKLIPLMINNILHKKPLPVYGEGNNVRDWLFVEDHARAISTIFSKGKIGDTYNIGGHNEWTNIDLVKLLCKLVDQKMGNQEGQSEKLITFVMDRAGHDLRYAIDATKLKDELGWVPSLQFEEGLSKTIDWFLSNKEWLDHVTSGEYQKYYSKMYN